MGIDITTKAVIKRIARRVRSVGDERGFTLIELMVTIAISSIVLLSVGMMSVTMQRYWDRTSKKVALIRDASASMNRMSYEIRKGERDSVFAYGDSIHIWSSGVRSSFRQDGTDLVFQGSAGIARLAEGVVDSLYFSYAAWDSSAIGVFLRLSDGGVQTQFSTIVGMRN